jgi:DNA repair protein RadC
MKTIVKKYSVALVKESAHKYADIPGRLDNPGKNISYADSILNFEAMTKENFILIPVDTKLKPLGVFVLTTGTINASLVSTRDVFQAALLCNAASIFVLHNHPSGDPSPSRQDKGITKKLIDAGKLMEIPLVDHVIVGDVGENKYYSFKVDGNASGEFTW